MVGEGRRPSRLAAGLALMLALAGCTSDDDPGAGGVTEGEARELNEAAAALDVNATTEEAE